MDGTISGGFMPKVGDHVQFKTYEEMKNEFGVDSDGDIQCDARFTYEMKDVIPDGYDFIVTRVNNTHVYGSEFDGRYFITIDMLKYYDGADLSLCIDDVTEYLDSIQVIN